MREAVIVSAVRTPVGKAKKGTLKDMRPDDMAAAVIAEAVKRTPGLKPEEIDDVILGCAMPEAEQGMNVARIASLRAGLPPEVSAITINRFCSSGLQSIAFAAERIQCGSAEVVAAGGTESMSMVPMAGHKFSPNPYLDRIVSRRLSGNGVDGREPGSEVPDQARGAGWVFVGQPSKGRRQLCQKGTSRKRLCRSMFPSIR